MRLLALVVLVLLAAPLQAVEPRHADPMSLVFYKKILITKAALAKIEEMLA